MKPSRSALLGAIVVSGGWMSLPGVAFATGPISAVATAPERSSAASALAHGHASKGTCPADTHTHSASCTCAGCAAARNG